MGQSAQRHHVTVALFKVTFTQTHMEVLLGSALTQGHYVKLAAEAKSFDCRTIKPPSLLVTGHSLCMRASEWC